jgi:glycine/D-amino acid oxidase-like deaminating enzyme
MRQTARVQALQRRSPGWEIETDRGSLRARRVILAVGLGEQPSLPEWAAKAGGQSYLRHLFDADSPTRPGAGHKIVIVGGGISAVQAALHYAGYHPGNVTLITRSPLRRFEFDSDPCWLGPRCLNDYGRLTDARQRRIAISTGRRPGTVPHEVASAFEMAIQEGRLSHRIANITSARTEEVGRTALYENDSAVAIADAVICATGFDTKRPAATWLDNSIAREPLPLSSCGYPIVGPDLAWADGLYVSGPLAELEIGPVSRNISGARLAGRRLLRVARESQA